MNTNNGKTGIIDIPAPLHSTGGDGDGQVGNVVAYTGDIWDDVIGANQREINAKTAKMDNNYNLNLGFGVVAQAGSFGFGSDFGAIYLTGNNKSYTATLVYNQGTTYVNSVLGSVFRLNYKNSYLLNGSGTRVAKITNIGYNANTQVITLTLDTNLGELNDQYYCLENLSGQYNFNAGTFGNKGTDSVCLGYFNMNRGYYGGLIGSSNSNSANYGSVIGTFNYNAGSNGTVIGSSNVNNSDYAAIVGNYNSAGAGTIGIALGSSINIYRGQNTGLGNNSPSAAFALGGGLTLSHPSIALGMNNKDYDISGDTQNYFTLGGGEGQNRLNLLEQSKNGNLFIKGVGGFDGTNSQSASTKSLQDVLNDIEAQIASASASTSGGGVTSWNDLEDKPTILDSYDVRQIVLEKSPLHYDDNYSNYVTFIPNGSSDSYTPNGLNGTSKSILVGMLNTFNNTYNGIVLGNSNTTDGNKDSDSDDSTVIIGKSNTNASRNSVLIGDYNNNNQNKSVMLGSTNINKSYGGVNIGYYNQNNGGERSVMLGYDNTTSNSANTLCMGSENRFTMFSSYPKNQEIIAIGRGLQGNASGIFLGYYNVTDSVLTGDTANFLTIGNGSGNTYSSTRSNIIEQRRNGDIFIKGIGNYDGTNSRYGDSNPYRGKSLQEVLNQLTTDIQSVSANTGGGSGSGGGSVSVTSDEDWVNEVLPGAVLVSGVTITAKWITDTNRGNYVYLGFEADQEVDWDMIDIDVYEWGTEHHYNRYKQDYTRICNNCLMTELNQLQILNGDVNAISEAEVIIEAKPSFGYSYTIDYDESIANQMYENDGWWEIYNNGEISY